MLAYIVRRSLLAVLTVWAVSALSFVIIQLPPGDYIDAYVSELAAAGGDTSEEQIAALRHDYGLDQPIYVQYAMWMWQVAQGKFGMSMEWKRPVSEVIGDRLTLTMVVSLAALLLTWAVALPFGIHLLRRTAGPYIWVKRRHDCRLAPCPL